MNIMLFVVSTFSLLLISVTMLYRANDLRWRKGWNWNVRLIGFVLCGAAPIGIVGTEYFFSAWPNAYETFFRVGLLCVFITTPNLPPWWRWVSGREKADDTN